MNEEHINDAETASQVQNQRKNKIKDQIEWEISESEHFGIFLPPLVNNFFFSSFT